MDSSDIAGMNAAPVNESDGISLSTHSDGQSVDKAEAEAKAALDAQRAKIRHEVLYQADLNGWCEDGVRRVLADLRLPRPGPREERTVTARIEIEYRASLYAYTTEAAAALAYKVGAIPNAGVINDALGASRVVGLVIRDVRIDGRAVEGAQ